MATTAKNLQEFPPDHTYLVSLTLQACEVARTAVANVADALATGAPALYLAVDEAEKKLDSLDRELDERLSHALGDCAEPQRRELLSCMKFMTDLERIGDLISTFASGARALGSRLEPHDVQDLIRIATVLEKMLTDVEQAFSKRDLNRAIAVLRADGEIDRLRNLLFVRHVENPGGTRRARVFRCCSWRSPSNEREITPRTWQKKLPFGERAHAPPRAARQRPVARADVSRLAETAPGSAFRLPGSRGTVMEVTA
jgi:hypothetical protein